MRDLDLKDLIDDGSPPRSPYFKWVVIGGVILVLWALASVGTALYTDFLWFEELGYEAVFSRTIASQIGMFAIGAVLFAALLAANVFAAQKLSPRETFLGSAQLPPEAVAWLRQLVGFVLVVGTLVLAIVFGLAASSAWEPALRYLNGVPFGINDPLFSKDVSFYVFNLPFYRFIQNWLVGAVVLTGLICLGLYAVNFSLSGFRFQLTPGIRGHLSALGAVFFLLIGFGYWLDINELVFSVRSAAFGAGFTDVNAQMPALWVLVAVAILSAVALVANIVLQSARLPVIALGVWAAALVLGAGVYPTIIQRFEVEPNEFEREARYIANTIDMTRKAYALDRITLSTHNVQPDLTITDIQENPVTVQNLRLWDYRPLLSLYNQIQFFQLYYRFHDIDVDRYTVDGQYRQVMLGAREMTGPPAEARTWTNETLQYTHGYGVAMSPTTEFNADGTPLFFIQDIPPAGKIPIKQPQIYFGEITDNYVIVNTSVPELDHPEAGRPVYTSYAGKGGIVLDSFLKKLLFGWRFGDLNLPITGQLKDDSRILFQRNVPDRVTKVAPFLRLDHDPYVVVGSDGNMYWIQDAYTETSHFPYSERFSPTINYIRNSVKAVINAYDGSMDLYIADDTDAMIKTYAAIFPGLFKPLSEMPEELRSHIRYPQDLFQAQSQMYLRFHMTDPQVFYNKEDLWATPKENFSGQTVEMDPYYTMMRLPDGETEEFTMIFPFTPFNKPNLAGWMAARNDGPHYGKLEAFTFSTDGRIGQVSGPEQVQAAIAGDPDISQQFTLWRGASQQDSTAGTDVLQGNLLIIPIGNTLIYAEPIFLRPKNLDQPKLTAVVLVTPGQKPVMAPTLNAALTRIIGQQVTTPTGGEPGGGEPVTDDFRRKLQEQITGMQNAINGLTQQLQTLNKALQDLSALASESTTPTPIPAPR